MLKLNRAFMLFTFLFALQSGLFAETHLSPVISFDTFLIADTSTAGSAFNEYAPSPPQPIENGHFPLLIGATSEYIQEYIQNGGPPDKPWMKSYFRGVDYRFKTYSLTNQVTLLEVSYFYYLEDVPGRTFPRMLGTYILKDGISIGVLLFDNLRVYRPQEAAYYQSIRQLPRDSSTLRQAMPNIPVKKMQFYQALRSDQWIEKYALMHVHIPAREMYDIYGFAKHTIMLQAFYPAELEGVLQDYIARTLAHNVEHAGVLPPDSTATPLNQRTPEIQQEQMGDESEN